MSSMIEVLEQHLKQNIRGCMCGWAEIGKSHTVHVADELAKAGYGDLEEAYRLGRNAKARQTRARNIEEYQAREKIKHKRRNAKSLETATRHYQAWSGADIEIALDPNITEADAARRLGRTRMAIKSCRRRYRYGELDATY